MKKFPLFVLEGGPGSGHWGHKGLKGVWGGSSSDGSSGKRGVESSGFLAAVSDPRSKVEIIKDISTGVNPTSKVKITAADGTEYFACRKIIKRDMAESAVVAFRLSEFLGLENIPSTVIRKEVNAVDEFGRRKVEIFTEWVNIEDWTEFSWAKDFTGWVDGKPIPYSEYEKMVLFDVLTWHKDRHGGNFGVSKDGKIWLTDNDMIIDKELASLHVAKGYASRFDLFGGVVREMYVADKVFGREVSLQARNILRKLTGSGGEEALRASFSEVVDKRYAVFFSKAIVQRAKALQNLGSYDWDFLAF